MSDVIDVICTLLLRKYPSIEAVYECTGVPFRDHNATASLSELKSRQILRSGRVIGFYQETDSVRTRRSWTQRYIGANT